MGGKVLELESERLKAEGRTEGEAIGQARGGAIGQVQGEASTPSGQQQEFTLMENFAILH